MGGFQIISADGTSRRLSVSGSIPANTRNIAVQEIEDRSKGDFIAKTIVMLQILWFTLQMVIRVSQGLTVTELELTTVGHTISNIFIYWCWWNKPVNVNFPFNVYPETVDKRINGSGHGRKSESVRLALTKLQQMRIRLGTYLGTMMQNGLCNTRSWEGIVMIICGIILGGMFGAVHGLAWNTRFPTDIESKLWKASVIVVTAAPGAGILLEIAMKQIQYLPFFVPVGLTIYALGRICLIVLSLLALRDLPYDAYATPSWSIYMPHFA